MRRYSDVVLIIVVFLVTSEALSAGKLHNQLKPSELTSQKTRPSHGFLRAVSTAGGDDEERGMLGSKIYMQLSKLAKKANMKELSQNLKHKSWRVSGDNPQTLFQKNSEKWKGKPDSDLMGDSEFIHYKVLAKAWPEVQYRKGTWHRPGDADREQRRARKMVRDEFLHGRIGVLQILCDPATKQYLLHLNETAVQQRFVIEDLDDTHLFIVPDLKVIAFIEKKMDEWNEKNTYQPPTQ